MHEGGRGPGLTPWLDRETRAPCGHLRVPLGSIIITWTRTLHVSEQRRWRPGEWNCAPRFFRNGASCTPAVESPASAVLTHAHYSSLSDTLYLPFTGAQHGLFHLKNQALALQLGTCRCPTYLGLSVKTRLGGTLKT